ncbi:response regulator transcription factor [Nisaea sediminum]|uniref:response regulator transcription factor n=1 Tax=Nisaea sediminum TaxID=2775867 RepID=UPI001865BAE2|nr:response regulator transcription factor [Nisaea sediminum]
MTSSTTGSTISVIVVEDERELLEEVVAFLTARGMDVRSASDGRTFWQHFEERVPDVVVLDLGLAAESGAEIAAAARAREPSLGIVMATARGSVQDRIDGYETGANVYLVKPVDLGELAAAVQSIQRQRERNVPRDRQESSSWNLNLLSWQLTAPDGQSIQLTRAESQLLDCLTEAPGKPVSRFEIGRRMGKSEYLEDHRFVDQVIRRLRRKIEAQLGTDAPIGSAHGQGYYFMQSVIRG